MLPLFTLRPPLALPSAASPSGCAALPHRAAYRGAQDASKTDELKATQAELTAEQDKLEATLAKLNALESKKLAMQVSSTTRGKGRLQRMSTTLHMDDPAANDAIKSAMADLGQTAGGRDAVAGLLKKHSSQRAF